MLAPHAFQVSAFLRAAGRVGLLCLGLLLLAGRASLAAAVAGKITDSSNGAPIAGAVVSACGTDLAGQVITNATGDYTIPLPAAGEYLVCATAEGYVENYAFPTVAASGTTTVNLSLTSEHFGTLAGTVRDAVSSAPIAGVQIVACNGAGHDAGVTGADGTYALTSVPAGANYTVCFKAGGYAQGSSTGVIVQEGLTTTVNAALTPVPSGAVGGVVRDTEGNPLAGAMVNICTAPEEPDYVLSSVTTAEDGTYLASPVAAGSTVQVCAWDDEYDPQIFSDVTVSVGQTTVVDFSLEFSGPPSGAGELSCPYWNITLDDFGYADWMIQTYPGQCEHENLSGEWAAAIRYDGLPTAGGRTMWLPPTFWCPDYTSNSTFTIVEGLSTWDDPGNPVVGWDTGRSHIANGAVDIVITYQMREAPGGISAGLRPGGLGDLAPLHSGPYVLQQTYAITNTSAGPLTNLAFFQMLHAHPNDEYGPANYAVYDPSPYEGGAFPEYHYGLTTYGVSLHNPPGSDITGFSSAVAPSQWGIGQYPGHESEPGVGLNQEIYAGQLSGALSGGPAEIAGAMKWDLGTLASGATVTHSVLLWNGWAYPQVPEHRVVSPYPTRESWEGGTWYRHRGQLHAHYMPDGTYTVDAGGNVHLANLSLKSGPFLTQAQVLEKYQERGYDFVALTEHQPDSRFDAYTRNLIYGNPIVPGIIALPGSYEDTATRGILGVACGAGLNLAAMGPGNPDFVRLSNITTHSGLAVVAEPNSAVHPWSGTALRSARGWYQGLEVFNQATWYDAFAVSFAATYEQTGDAVAARERALTAAHHQANAVARWDDLLAANDSSARCLWAVAGDDFTPTYAGEPLFDEAAVVVWTHSALPVATEVREAMKAGRFYSCQGGSRAPEVLAYWADAMSHTITVQTQEECEVTFVSARRSRAPAVVAAARQTEGRWLARYDYLRDDGYVRAEVRGPEGGVAWLQPMWIEEAQEVTGVLPAVGVSEKASEPYQLALEDAVLSISYPQPSTTWVGGELLNGADRPAVAPGIGYLSRCYQLKPDVTLMGMNTLTLRYFPDTRCRVPASALGIYRFTSTTRTWQRLASTVDTVAGEISAPVTRLGIYAISAEAPEDVAGPSVSITAPAAGGTISAPVTFAAEASDDVLVVRVSFLANGVLLGVDEWGGDGWGVALDPARYAAGPAVLTAVAEDTAGHRARAAVSVTMAAPVPAPSPAMVLTLPAEGAQVWGDLHAEGLWTGSLPMTSGAVTMDGQIIAFLPVTADAWTLDVSLPPAASGERVLQVTGSDRYGNVATASCSVVAKVFGDAPPDFWARPYIYAIARAGLAGGYPDGLYHPEVTVTRDQMAVYVTRALVGSDANVPEGPPSATFPDVEVGSWAYRHVEYCVSQHIVGGYPDGLYRPLLNLDRGQMAVFMARAMVPFEDRPGLPNYVAPETPSFPDVSNTGYGSSGTDPFWAYREIEYIRRAGVVGGYPDGRYHPEVTCTRDQMAVFIERAFSL